MNLYQTSILIASIVVLTCFVKIYILMFIVMSVMIVLSSLLLGKYHDKRIIAVNVVVLLSAFIFLKNITGYALPIGYSVFAFSAISLLVDQYKSYKKYSLLEVLCFLYFFPKIFAGPIDRVDRFVDQIRTSKEWSFSNVYVPMKMCVYASLYKYVVADHLYILCYEPYAGINEVLSILCYGIAFFLDFYAYSIFAIAFGKLFGVSLSENFNSPYSSSSFREFWRRWNITLGTWLRDYIYIPLGGNKVSAMRLLLIIFVIFLVSAIWHNMTAPFLLWGIAHAFLVIIERILNIRGNRFYGLYVFTISIMLWQLFDVADVNEFANRIARIFIWQPINGKIIIGTIVSLVALWFAERNTIKRIIFTHKNTPRYILKETTITSIILVIVVLLSNNPSINFFYMKF